MNLNLTSQNTYSITVHWCAGCGSFLGYLGYTLSATVSLVYINLQPEYELPSSTCFGQFQKFEKFELEYCPLQPPLRKKILHGVWVLVHSYLRVRFDLPSSINVRDINGFPKLGLRTLIRGYPRGSKVVSLDSTGMISNYLLIIPEEVSCTVSEI